jgi:hypothetical protein
MPAQAGIQYPSISDARHCPSQPSEDTGSFAFADDDNRSFIDAAADLSNPAKKKQTGRETA